MKLKKLGFYDDMSNSDAIKLLSSTKNTLPSSNINKIVEYLRNGYLLFVIPGLSFDLLSNEEIVIGPPNIRTDGEWAWTEDFIFYVEKYHISIMKGIRRHGSG